MVGSARIVAIGEATHSTRECFQLKHRIFEFLVTRMGFRVFALEANWTESLAINDYVVRGRGDPKHALAELWFWTWYTEELVDLIVWMRQYNTDPRHPAKLKFVGFDMQRPAAAARAVQGYLAEVDPGTAREYKALLDAVAESEAILLKSREVRPEAAGPEALAKLKDLGNLFKAKRHDYVALSGLEKWSEISGDVRLLPQAMEWYAAYSKRADSDLRDRFLAENLQWIADNEAPESRIMISAANSHVGYWPVAMGGHLRRIYGPGVVNIGFFFNQGSFRAISKSGSLAVFSAGPSPAETLQAVFASTGIPIFLLDLRRAKGGFRTWFASEQPARELPPRFDHPVIFPVAAAKLYDCVAFVDRTSASRALSPK